MHFLKKNKLEKWEKGEIGTILAIVALIVLSGIVYVGGSKLKERIKLYPRATEVDIKETLPGYGTLALTTITKVDEADGKRFNITGYLEAGSSLNKNIFVFIRAKPLVGSIPNPNVVAYSTSPVLNIMPSRGSKNSFSGFIKAKSTWDCTPQTLAANVSVIYKGGGVVSLAGKNLEIPIDLSAYCTVVPTTVPTTPPTATPITTSTPSSTPTPPPSFICSIPGIGNFGNLFSCPTPEPSPGPSKYDPLEAEKSIPQTSSTAVRTSIADSSGKKYGREIIPTVLGTVSDYTGSATFDYPFLLPKGPAGFSPSLGISYSSQTIDDARAGDNEWNEKDHYIPSQVGHGFSLSGLGYIVRDSRGNLGWPIGYELDRTTGKPYNYSFHRFIVNLPGVGSFELRSSGGKWVSIPQGFLKIEGQPDPVDLAKEQPTGFNYYFYGGRGWTITTKDGTKYLFGEEKLWDKLESNGKVKQNVGNVANEFADVQICTAGKESPCDKNEGVNSLVVTKWLLREIQTSDGKKINFSYNSFPKTITPLGNSLNYKSTSTYPKEVSWNEGKYRVLFNRKPRDDKGRDDLMTDRINEILVEVKLPTGQFSLARKYVIGYSNGDDLGISNPWKISLVKSITEFGKDDETTKLPPVTFSYKAPLLPPHGVSGQNIYLGKINNGQGGETEFHYEYFSVPYRDLENWPKAGELNDTGSGTNKDRWGTARVRVSKKEVRDFVGGAGNPVKSFREEYTYSNPKGFMEKRGDQSAEFNFCDHKGCVPPSGLQFLGHGRVEVKTFDFDTNGAGLLLHSVTVFNQANEKSGCFEPHPAKGIPKDTITYNGTLEAKKVTSQYRTRLNNATDSADVCDSNRVNQPYFVYLKRTDNFVTEPTPVPNNPFTTVNDANVRNSIKSQIRIATEIPEGGYDTYGNVIKSASLGEVDNGNGSDLDKNDNRYSFTKYLTNSETQAYNIFTLPSVSYSSTKSDCDGASSCARGKTEIFYENKENKLSPLINFGWPTKQKTYLASDKVVITKTGYDNYGNVKSVSSLLPNKETNAAADEAKVKLMSETSYDSHYNVLPKETKKYIYYLDKQPYTQSETIDYDDSSPLQLPKRVSTQIQKDKPIYNFIEMKYDALGRVIESYTKDPRTEGSLLNVPVSKTFYYDRDTDKPSTNGYVVRSMVLSSKDGADGMSGNYTYSTTDTFYDGLGSVRQSQILKTAVNGQLQNLVSSAPKTNSAGATIDTYEPQTTNAVDSSHSPTYKGVGLKIMSHTDYDNLGRPTITTQTTDSGQLTTENSYMVNGVKTISSNGVEKISISDPWGRPVYNVSTSSIVDNKSQVLLTANTYGQSIPNAQGISDMIDKPTKVEVKSLVPGNNLISTSTFSYDQAGRVISSTDPSLGSFEYTYDILGNKIKETQVDSSKKQLRYTTFAYDSLGRVATSLPGPLGLNEKIFPFAIRTLTAYYYDSAPYSLGKMSKVDDPSGTTEYFYDQDQRIKQTKKTIFDTKTTGTERSKTFWSTYDELSRPFISTLGGRDQIKYGYDFEGRNQKVYLSGSVLQNQVLVDKFGKTKLVKYDLKGLEMSNENTYDSLGRIRKIETGIQSGIPGGFGVPVDFLTQDVNYNERGEIGSTTETGKQNTFTYDGFSQLKSVTGGSNAAYEYDPFGRMLSKKEEVDTTLQYPQVQEAGRPLYAPLSVSSKLAGASPQTLPSIMNLKYDYQGNLSGDDKNCYKYNLLGQLTETKVKKVTSGTLCDTLKPTDFTKVITLAYDFEGSLVYSGEYTPTYQLQKQLFIYGTLEEEYQKIGASLVPSLTNTRLNIPLVGYVSAVKTRSGSSEKILYIVKDYLSSTRQVVDRATGGAVGEKIDYYPFGSFVKKKTF